MNEINLFLPLCVCYVKLASTMLIIRLQRVGRKKVPLFRLVLTDSKNSTKSGKYVEVLGSYNPHSKKDKLVFDDKKVKHWMGMGAKISATVHNIFVDAKVIVGKKVKSSSSKKGEPKKDNVKPEESKPATETASPSEPTPAPVA